MARESTPRSLFTYCAPGVPIELGGVERDSGRIRGDRDRPWQHGQWQRLHAEELGGVRSAAVPGRRRPCTGNTYFGNERDVCHHGKGGFQYNPNPQAWTSRMGYYMGEVA